MDIVLNIIIENEVIIERLGQRRTCSKCRAIYNLTGRPPKIDGTCDICGGDLYQREDDNETTVRKRLTTYHKETEPLIEFYKEKGILKNVESGISIKETHDRICRIVGC
jgi:adenylate kinase